MFKLRAALLLATLAGFITIISGILNDTRPVTALFRAGISAIVFGCCGFLISSMTETFWRRVSEKLNRKGQSVDIISDGDAGDDFAFSQSSQVAEEEFRPFTPDMVKRVYRSN